MRKRIRNASILESFLAFFILLLILFGMLQVYRFMIARMVVDYASFRGARSAAVGFKDYLVKREVHVKLIPVSGKILEPFRWDSFSSELDRYVDEATDELGVEKSFARRYMSGIQYMNYQYWRNGGGEGLHTNYKCPQYGKKRSGGCAVCGKFDETGVEIRRKDSGLTVKVESGFLNYPLTMPLYEIFTKTGTLDLQQETELANHAELYLE